MTGGVDDSMQAGTRILHWYDRSQIDYEEYFIRVYIAYNAWYRRAVGSSNDRRAIELLKKRAVLWDAYISGRALLELERYMIELAECTQRRPLTEGSWWNGEVRDRYDWRSLIEFWYSIRCALVHGSHVPHEHTWLAYKTLSLYMHEITQRLSLRLKSYPEAEPWGVDIITVQAEGSSANNCLQHLRNTL
jgi:hypothetical protein